MRAARDICCGISCTAPGSRQRPSPNAQTVRFKNELERNITIKLGYANAKIYKCEDESCPRPSCYRCEIRWQTVAYVLGIEMCLFPAFEAQLTAHETLAPSLSQSVRQQQGGQPDVRGSRL